MFDGKIDFMDFNKIKINYGGKLTCRKIFKKRFLIFVILSIISIIFLAILFTVYNRKLEGILIETKEFIEQKSQIDNIINSTKNQNIEEEKNLYEFQGAVEIIRNDLKEINKKEESIKATNTEIISERDKLERKSTSLSEQLKTEMELKEVYQQKLNSLNTLLNSLKIEYDKLMEQKGNNNQQEEEYSNIENSKILDSYEVFTIEKRIKGKIKDKCFDGVKDNYNPTKFHEKCDNSALLILIKTDKNERIGAFSKVSFDGTQIKKDPYSFLFNIDERIFYTLDDPQSPVIFCDPNLLPLFGIDLQIKTNGQGVNYFPFNYGDKEINTHEDLTKDSIFTIEDLEIYKVEL